jgi:hypothetical protein
MKFLSLLIFIICTSAHASSVVGLTTHPLSDDARAISLETTGYFSQRQEMGIGLRYTHGIQQGQLLDIMAGSAQYSRGFTFGAGMDFEILQDEGAQPRVSIKPFYQQQKFEGDKSSVIGGAPTLRKSVDILGTIFNPFIAVPLGVEIDSSDDEFVYYASLSFGASMAIPNTEEKLLVSLEGNKNMGASSDYLGALLSWVWN